MTISFNDILKLTKQLFPTGRAWKLPENSTFRKMMYALGKSEQRAVQAAVDTLNRILPDNSGFTEDDATEWERRLNIISGTGFVPFETRKATILRKYQFPGGFLNRQNYRYIEAQLQLAGYDVTITENFAEITPLTATVHASTTLHGVAVHGGAIRDTDIVANSINMGEVFTIDTYFGAFIVEGTIPISAIRTFRQLILTLKPANTVAILRLTYTNERILTFMDGNYIEMLDDKQLELITP